MNCAVCVMVLTNRRSSKRMNEKETEDVRDEDENGLLESIWWMKGDQYWRSLNEFGFRPKSLKSKIFVDYGQDGCWPIDRAWRCTVFVFWLLGNTFEAWHVIELAPAGPHRVCLPLNYDLGISSSQKKKKKITKKQWEKQQMEKKNEMKKKEKK